MPSVTHQKRPHSFRTWRRYNVKGMESCMLIGTRTLYISAFFLGPHHSHANLHIFIVYLVKVLVSSGCHATPSTTGSSRSSQSHTKTRPLNFDKHLVPHPIRIAFILGLNSFRKRIALFRLARAIITKALDSTLVGMHIFRWLGHSRSS